MYGYSSSSNGGHLPTGPHYSMGPGPAATCATTTTSVRFQQHPNTSMQNINWQQQRFQMQQQQQQGGGTVVMGVPYHQGTLLRSALSNTMPSPPPYDFHCKVQRPPHHVVPVGPPIAGTNMHPMMQQQCNNINNNILINSNVMKTVSGVSGGDVKPGIAGAGAGAMSDTVMMSPTSLCSTPNDIDERLLDSCDKMSSSSVSSCGGASSSSVTSSGEDEEAVLEYWTHLALELGVHLLKELPQLDGDVDVMCGGS